eukprot:gene12188-biopygen8155
MSPAAGSPSDISGATQGCYNYHLGVAAGMTGTQKADHCAH